MSGTLGDVFLFRPNGGFPGVAVEDTSGGMSLDDKDDHKQRKDNSNALGSTNIEWQQLLKDGVNANAGNRPIFGDSDSGSFTVHNHQKFHFMGSLVEARSGGPWDCSRTDSTAVNYLQTFGPVSSGSNGGVDRQLGEIRRAVDGQQQMLTDVLRRPSSSCEVAAEVPSVKEEEEFRCSADSASTISSHILQGGTITTSGQQQQMFATPRGLISSPTSMQPLSRSPNHAIRNLFPEKSSSFSSAMLQSHEDLRGSNIDEQGLLQLPKKPRMQDYGDGTLLSSPLPLADGDTHNRLSHGSASGQYRKATFVHDQRSNALASLMDCSSSYSKSSPTSFSHSFPPADRSTPFNASNLSSLQNPTISLSSFQNSGCPLLPMNSSSNDTVSMKSHIVDYGRYTLDPSSRIQGGDYRAELLVSDRDPSSFLGVSSPQPGLNFMPLVGSIGSGPFNFSCRRQSSLDAVGHGAWPAGLISNIPSLSMETPSRPLLLSKRSLRDREQPDGLLEDREARRVNPVTETRRRMLIQKQLTTTDVGSLGRIILPKKEAETHLPHLPDKEGIEMYMYDYEADRTWTMKYRFWPNNKSRMYLLENTGEFAKFHALQQGDWLFIYRESVSRYVLRAKKSAPLLQVTPSSQGVTEPSDAAAPGGPAAAPAAAEDVGGPVGASGTGRGPTNYQSPSPVSTTDGGGSGTPSSCKEVVCGTPAVSSNQHPLNVPSSRFSASSGAGGEKCSAQQQQQIVVEAKSNPPVPTPPHHHPQQQHDQLPSGTLNSGKKHLVHHVQPIVRAPSALRAGTEEDQRHHEQHQHQELRLKNYMAVQQQQPDHDMPSELDGGGEFNLEDFPRLIEADDETIDNILGHSEQSHASVDVRCRALSLRGRGEEEPSSSSSSSRRSI